MSSAGSARLRSVQSWLNDSVPDSIRHSILPVEGFGYAKKAGKLARQGEFQAGRFCAQQVLSSWNVDKPIHRSTDRSPIWPEGFSGSISHSKNWVWASLAKSDPIRSIGIDTEAIVDASTRSETLEQTATLEELRTLEALELDPCAEFTVLFSAKEAFYKCWYPVSKQYFGFKDAIVESCMPGQLTIRPTENNPISQSEPSHSTVEYFVDSQDVFTVCWMTAAKEKA